MIPAVAWSSEAAGAPVEAVDPALLIASLIRAIDPRDTTKLSVTGGIGQGNAVDAVTPVAGSELGDAAASGSDRPAIDLVKAPGIPALRCHGGRRLAAPGVNATSRTVVALVWLPVSSTINAQVVATRDTSATTTSPAWELRAG